MGEVYTTVPPEIIVRTCKCGAEVSGPVKASVDEHMSRHEGKAHPPKAGGKK